MYQFNNVYNLRKPDLIIHPLYYKQIITTYNDLGEYFNIFSSNDLKTQTIEPILLYENTIQKLSSVTMIPSFNNSFEKKSGSRPEFTTFTFDKEQKMFQIEENGPRYVIWTKNDPLTVCCTCIHRINIYDLNMAVDMAKNWATELTEQKSIIVFDLDLSLIDNKNNKLKYADTVLNHAKHLYDFVVLYSHGSKLHVDENVEQFEPDTFDLVLSNNSRYQKKTNKNILHLYNYFPNVRFTKTTLFDDSIYNYTPEYNKFIIPYTNNLQLALSVL